MSGTPTEAATDALGEGTGGKEKAREDADESKKKKKVCIH
jgi:hypothetical protein